MAFESILENVQDNDAQFKLKRISRKKNAKKIQLVTS